MAKAFTESKFQESLVRALKAQGFRVKKMQSGMGYTVLDLYVRSIYHGPVWIELKTVNTIKEAVGLTALQARDIEEELDFGGAACCLVGVKRGNEEHVYYHRPSDTHVREENLIDTRPFRGEWNCDRIIHRSVALAAGECVRKPSSQSSTSFPPKHPFPRD